MMLYNALKDFPSVSCWQDRFCFKKGKTVFWSYSGHKIAEAIVSDLSRSGFSCCEGVRLRCYNADDGGGGEWRRRKNWGIWRRCKS